MALSWNVVFATVALLALTALPPQGRMPPDHSLLLDVTSDSGATAYLNPIALWDGHHFDSLPGGGEDSISEDFRRAYYVTNRRYRTLAGGQPVGWVVTTGPGMYGCSGLPGLGRLSPAKSAAWSGLATNDSTLGGQFRRRAMSAPEARGLRLLGRAALRKLGASASAADSAKTLRSWAYEEPGQNSPLLVGSYLREEPDPSGRRALSVFLIATFVRDSVRADLTWTHAGREGSTQVRQLVDAIDFNRDGHLEVVTGTSYYESDNYQIYQRAQSGWALIYESTIWGC